MNRRVALGCARRRGAVAIMVVACMVVLLGFAALTIDVGLMYNARADLQRSADAAALAAAAMLSEYELGEPTTLASETAREFVEKNWVVGRSVTIAPSDVEFLRSRYDGDHYTFTPTWALPDAVRVTVRLSEDSPNGPLGLFFAGIFGRTSTNVSASATAGMIPRDIAIVADLSASHTDDSELRKYRYTDINMYDVWSALPGGFGDINSVWSSNEIPSSWMVSGLAAQAAGPAWGYMKKLGFGTIDINRNYDPTTDPGLVSLPYRQNWSQTGLSAYLTEKGYSANEINAIMSSGASDSTTTYPARVAVALGLANWGSGQTSGRWASVGQTAGDGDNIIDSSEIVWAEKIMDRLPADSATIWMDYVSYMMSTNTTMYGANSAFQYRYGVKTFLNYVLEKRPEPSQTFELANVPTQPMQAVKEGIGHMMDQLTQLETQDLVSLEVYSTIGVHEVDLTDDFSQISTRLSEMQAAHYGHYTNIGAGLERAIEELSSPRARASAKKVIVLYTDGIANINERGQYDLSGARQYAWDMAELAASKGFRIYAVSVGSEPDRTFMTRIAELGDGTHYHAQGSIEQYSLQLDRILNLLTGKRGVQLLQ